MESGRIKALETELAANKNGDIITFKVSQRGALSVYGLQRFPITLYRSQWGRLLDHQEELKQFIKDNASQLKIKKS